MKKLLLTLTILLMWATWSQACTFEWCSAAKPTIAGEKIEGTDNCGNYCSKFGIEVVKEVIKEVQQSTEGAKVTLSTDANGQPIFEATCPYSGFNEWDYKMHLEGFVIKIIRRGDKYYSVYEKQ